MARSVSRVALVSALVAGLLLQAAPASAGFVDVGSGHWAYDAVVHVAQTNAWMRDYGTSRFRPARLQQRRLLARALVRMYAPTDVVDPDITFADLPPTDPFYRYANVAARRRWLPGFRDGTWRPLGRVDKRTFDRAIVRGMGSLADAVTGLASVRMADGSRYRVDRFTPFLQLGHWLGLHFNHGTEALELSPRTPMRRDQVAYGLWRASTLPSWKLSAASAFAEVELPTLDRETARYRMTAYALRQIGIPYVWGGEWHEPTPSGYCCGAQPAGGMDCSGFVWWTVKRAEGGYDAARFHPAYPGWSLPERSSADMARAAPARIAFRDLRVGDLMFFSSAGGTTAGSVDHVGLWLGNGWMIHSSSGRDGVTLEPVASGWYRDRFVFGRRLGGSASAAVAATTEAAVAATEAAGDGAREGAMTDGGP